MVKLKMPSGTSVGEVDRILMQVEDRLEGVPEIESMFRLSGGRVFGLYTLEVGNEGNLNIQLVPRSRREITTAQFIKKIRPLVAKVQAQTPGAKLPVKPRSTSREAISCRSTSSRRSWRPGSTRRRGCQA
jgi:HAE1 family hydrophobic/amphiphilic exporter-1